VRATSVKELEREGGLPATGVAERVGHSPADLGIGTGARSRGLLGLAAATVITVVLLLSGVTVGELALFSGFEVAYALLPGLALFRFLPERPTSMTETLAIAWPLGIAVEIGLFLISAVTGRHWIFISYPALAAMSVAPFLWSRRRQLSPKRLTMSLPPVGRWSAGIVLLFTCAAAAIVGFGLFAVSPLPRAIDSVSYYSDLVFHISLAAEILNHWPLRDPTVTGLPVHYHIFAHVDMAAAARATGIGLPTIALRLQPSLLIGVIALQLFVLGSKVGEARAAGFAAVALGLFAGSVDFSEADPSLFGGPIGVLGNQFSPSYYMGTVFFLALVIVVMPALTDPARHGIGSGRYWLLVLGLSLAAGGAKVAVLPVLGAGVGLFALLRGRVDRVQMTTVGRLLGSIAAALTITYFALYRGGSGGETVRPANYLVYSAAARVYRAASTSPLAVVGTICAAVLVLGAILLPLGGAALARDLWWPRRRESSPERLLMCIFAVSVVPFALLGIPGDSQGYFLDYGFLAAVPVSAAGLIRFAHGVRLSVRDGVVPATILGGGLAIVVLGLSVDHTHIALAAGYILATSVVIAAVGLVRSRLRPAAGNTRPSAASVVVVVVAALTLLDIPIHVVLPTAERLAQGVPTAEASGIERHRGLTAGLYRGLVWLRANSRPSDVLAVNNHTVESASGLYSSRYYYYSAFAERRVFLESWDFTPEGGRYLARGLSTTPFAALSRLNDAAVDRGSRSAIAVLYDRYGVRYIVVDRHHGPVSPSLRYVAQQVYSNPDVIIYRLWASLAARTRSARR
jgi:hypothetical protein